VNFYGVTYRSLFVSSNGLITFESPNSAYGNDDLTFALPQPAIAPLWDDWIGTGLRPMLLGKYEDLNGDLRLDRLIVEWNGVMGYSSSPSEVTFQAILSLNTGASPGAVVFNYLDLNSGDFRTNGGSATVGVKAGGTQGPRRLLASYDRAGESVKTARAIRIARG
jgi:hypothetical protein